MYKKSIFCIVFLFFAAGLKIAKASQEQINTASTNIVIKPAIFFDDKIITNFDIQNYKKILKILSYNQNLSDEKITEFIVNNLVKEKYYSKYLNKTVDKSEIQSISENYISNLYQELSEENKKNLDIVKSNKNQFDLMKSYISNEIMWTSNFTQNVAQNIVVTQKDIELFLKTHPNYKSQDVEQKIIEQKVEPIAISVLEQVKSFVYIKIIK
jgi:hypothetical protein